MTVKSCFAVIDIPGYNDEEKKAIFTKFALPKALKRIGLNAHECIVTDEAVDTLVKQFSDTGGIRGIEQAAEHMVANALYQIEVDKVEQVVFDSKMVLELLA